MVPHTIDQLSKLFPWSIFMEGLRLYGEDAIENGFASKDDRKYKFHIRDNLQQRLVRVELDENLDFSVGTCDCPRYYSEGICPHIICSVIHIGKHLRQNRPSVSQKALLDLMSAYDRQLKQKKNSMPIHLHLTLGVWENECRANFKIGTEKMYVLRRVSELMEYEKKRRPLQFGEKFTYYPERDRFASEDQSLFEFLKLLYELTGSRHAFAASEVFQGKYLHLSGYVLSMLLKSLHGKTFKFVDHIREIQVENIRILDVDPKIEFNISEVEENYLLNKGVNSFFRLTPDASYVYCNGAIYHTTEKFQQTAVPLFQFFLDTEKSSLEISVEQRQKFVTNTLFYLTQISEIRFDESVEHPPVIHPLEPILYLDQQGMDLTARLAFRYGTVEINPLLNKATEDGMIAVIRDEVREREVLSYLSEYNFAVYGEEFRMSDPDEIYTFLSENNEELLHSDLKVFYSEEVKRMMGGLHRKISADISFHSGLDMLEVSFDVEDFPTEEYQHFFSSLKTRKKYYRLRNGSFISLDNKDLEAFYELESRGDVDFRKVEDGKLRIPKYRALYLDSFIQSRDLNHIREHVNLKSLIDDIRNPGKEEYEMPSGLRATFREYQIQGYRWMRTLAKYGFGGILADEMGLGKTLQMIAFLKYLSDFGRGQSIVIVPTSLLYNWESELQKFAPTLDICVVSGSVLQRNQLLETHSGADVIITSYSLLRNDLEFYEGRHFACIVLDEAQYIKNAQSMNAKAVKKLTGEVRFALTGTPMENSLAELHSVFDFLMPGYLFSTHRFRELYHRPIMKEKDSSALESLKQHVRPFMLRRLKKEVLKELPKKIEQALMIELKEDQKKLYVSYLDELKKSVTEEINQKGYNNSRFKILSALTRLRQICADPSIFLEDYEGGSGKMDTLSDLLKDLIRSESRVLIFSSFTSVLHRIEERLRKAKVEYCYLDGATDSERRKEEVDAFNRGEGQIFLISLKAGGTGLNLTSADTVIHYDPWWNPAVEDQATDRAHRIGQKKTVQVLKLIAKGTIEEKIFELQRQKKDLIDQVVEDGEVLISKMTEEEIRKLFEE